MSEFYKIVDESTNCDRVVFDLIKYEGHKNVPFAEVVILTDADSNATLEVTVGTCGETLTWKAFMLGKWNEDFDLTFKDEGEYMRVHFNGTKETGDYTVVFKHEVDGIVIDVIDDGEENDVIALGWLSDEDLLGEEEWERRYA